MGHTVEARVHPNVVEVRYRDQIVQTMPRLRNEDEHRIDYRHVIGWLVRKPGAFARYRYREDLYPSVTFRRAYDAWRGRTASAPTWSICGSCSWPRRPAKCASPTRSCAVLDQAGGFDYVAVQAARRAARARRFRSSTFRRRT